MESLFIAQTAPHTAAVHGPAYLFDGQPGDQREQSYVWAADFLFPLVTGSKVNYPFRNGMEAGIQLPAIKQADEILANIQKAIG